MYNIPYIFYFLTKNGRVLKSGKMGEKLSITSAHMENGEKFALLSLLDEQDRRKASLPLTNAKELRIGILLVCIRYY